LECNHCQKRVTIPASFPSSHWKCPGCGGSNPVQVSQQSGSVIEKAPVQRKQSILLPILITAVATSVLTLPIGGLFGWAMARNSLGVRQTVDADAFYKDEEIRQPLNRQNNKIAKPPRRVAVAEQDPAPVDDPELDNDALLKRACDKWIRSNFRISRYVHTQIGKTHVVLGFNNSLVYVPKSYKGGFLDSSVSDGLSFTLGFLAEGADTVENAIGNHVKVDGETVFAPFVSSDERVAKVYKDGSCGLAGRGKCTVGVELPNGEQLSINVKTKSIPLSFSTTYDERSSAQNVVKILGLPDQKKEYSAKWPGAYSADGIGHAPQNPGVTLRFEHWKYDDYPGLVLSFLKGQNLHKMGTVPLEVKDDVR